MKSPKSRKVARTLRHTKKSKKAHASPAKSARVERERAVASSAVTRPEPALGAAIDVRPARPASPEFVPMGAEKAVATSSTGMNMFSNMAALQGTWMNLGIVQARFATAMMGAMFLPRGGPQQRRP
jgi:hypothetical protein